MKTLFSIIGAALLSLSSLFGGGAHLAGSTSTFYPTGGGTYYLQTSVGSTDTAVNLRSFTEPVSNIPYTMSYLNSSIEYGTLDPNSSTNSEFISFTGITENSDGTAQLTGVVRGLGRSYPYTASTTLAQPHSGGAIFILSNPPQLYQQYGALANLNTWYGINTFSSTSPPRLDEPGAQAAGSYIATTSEFASVAYVNAVTTSGAPNASTAVKGIVQLATAAQQASSTALGSTGAALVTSSSNATDTPQAKCNSLGSAIGAGCSVIATLAGHIAQAWIDLTANYAWTGTHTWTGTNGMIGIGTTTPYAPLSVVGQTVLSYFNATSTTATSTVYNLQMQHNATTTNLTISGTCAGCANGRTIITNTGALPTSSGFGGQVTASCTNNQVVSGGGENATAVGQGNYLAVNGPVNGTGWVAEINCNTSTLGSCPSGTMTTYAICVNP